jgi:hypothetical protein
VGLHAIFNITPLDVIRHSYCNSDLIRQPDYILNLTHIKPDWWAKRLQELCGENMLLDGVRLRDSTKTIGVRAPRSSVGRG